MNSIMIECMAFNQMITDQLRHYVYALADPRRDGDLKDQIFYIGKGKGNRCNDHAEFEKSLCASDLLEGEHKLSTIRHIHAAGREVKVLIVQHGLEEAQAFATEAVLIGLLGATNKVGGHGGDALWWSAQQVHEAYDNPIQRNDIEALQSNLLFVSLNRQDTEKLMGHGQEEQLAHATLGAWNIGVDRSRLVDLVIGVKNGLVVSVFKTIKGPDGHSRFKRHKAETKGAHGRSEFEGVRDVELEAKIRGRSILEGNKILTKIRPGAGCDFVPKT